MVFSAQIEPPGPGDKGFRRGSLLVGKERRSTLHDQEYSEVSATSDRDQQDSEPFGSDRRHVRVCGLGEVFHPEDDNSKSVYLAVLREAIKRIDQLSERS